MTEYNVKVRRTPTMEETNSERDVMTVAQLADYLGVRPNTVYGALGRNEIPHLRIGGRVLISKKVVDSILRGERTLERR
jgi:excisionase family DNA binding protein